MSPIIPKHRSRAARSLPTLVLVVLAAGALLAPVRVAHAITTASCLAQKQKAWGGLRKCEAGEKAKLLQAKPADFAKCQAKFDTKLGKISAKAADASVACRYGDNGDGTVTDYDTGLQWEQKVSPGGGASDPHDVDNTYTWNTTFGGTTPDGTAFTDFLDKLNNCASSDGSTVTGGFAGHCDWRLPSVVELEGIVDVAAGSPTIDPAFGPTAAFHYWSATTYVVVPNNRASTVRFDDGSVFYGLKYYTVYVRAVRTGL